MPSQTRKPETPSPRTMPRTGRMVTHFSLGSAFSSHGFSTSPLRTRRLWMYRWARSSKRVPPLALEEPKLYVGREPKKQTKKNKPKPDHKKANDTTPSPKG